MSAFDAGTIEATFDVDRSPFQRGLDEARRQADEFSRQSHTTTLDVDTRVAARELEAFEERLRAIRNPTIHPDVDTRVAAEELRRLEERVREATRDRTIIIRTQNVGGPGGNGPGGLGGAGGAGGAGGGLGIWGALIPLIGSILPAIVPLTLAATGLGVALASGFTMGALAVGSFAVVAKSQLSDVSAALKKVGGDASKLPAELQPLGSALEQLHFSFAILKQQTAGAVSGALIQGVHVLTSGMALVAPLINATGRGLQMMFAIFQNFVQGPTFKNFINLTKAEVGPALTAIGVILVNIMNAALRMFEIFNPILVRLGKAAENVSGRISDWSLNGGLDTFAKKVYATIQPVLAFLKAFGGALGAIWGALGSGGSSSLTFLTTLLNALKQLQPALTAIVQLFTPFELLIEKALPSLIPFVNLLGQLATAAIPLLNATVQGLVDGLQGLIVALTPVVHALIEFFNKIGPADRVLGFIAAGIIGVVVAFKILRAVLATDPIILALLAIAAVVVVIVDHWQGFKNFWIGLWNDVTRYFHTALRDIEGAWGAVSRFFERIWNDIYGFFKQYGAYILVAILPIVGIPLVIIQHWGAISRFFERIWNDVYGFFKKYGAYIVAALLPFIAIPVLIAAHWRQIVGWLDKVWNDVWRDVKSVWGAVIGFFEKIPGWIVGVFKSAGSWLLNAGKDIINGLWTGIKIIWATVIGFYVKVYSVILSFFASAGTWLLHAGESIITGLWNGIKTIWASVLGFYRSVYGTILGFFGSAVSWLFGAGENIITGLAHGLLAIWGTVISWLGTLFSQITDVFSNAYYWLLDVGKEIVQGLWDGIKQLWNDLTGWLHDAASGIGGIFKSVLSIFSPSRVMHQIGMYTMQGLHNGLRDTFDGVVAPYLDKAANAVSGAFGKGGALGGFDAHTTITTAAVVAVQSGQAGQTAALLDKVDELLKATRDLPTATGQAVGDHVGNIDKATAKQTRDLVTASRSA